MPKRDQPRKIEGASYKVTGRAKEAGGSLTGNKVKKAEARGPGQVHPQEGPPEVGTARRRNGPGRSNGPGYAHVWRHANIRMTSGGEQAGHKGGRRRGGGRQGARLDMRDRREDRTEDGREENLLREHPRQRGMEG